MPGTTLANLTLTASTGGTGLPFTVGHTFRKGDVPSANSVVVTGANVNAQGVVKNRWSDGSAKFAIISGTVDLSSGTATALAVSAGTASSGTALTTASLPSAVRTTGISIGCGSFGTVTFSGTDFDSPFATWVSGPRMSSWIYRKKVGTDAHLVAWIELRYYATGAVEVLPWIENGFLQVSGPTSKSATFTFSLGGTLRASIAIALPHHTRTPLISGTALSYWLGTDPGISFKHDAAYMMASELVPTYRATVSPSDPIVTALPSSFTPLQAGSFNYDGDSMASTGYQEPIGLLPQHDVLYLTTTANVYASVVRNGFSSGRYPIHYRDETTNRPFLFSSYPGLGIGDGQGFKDNGSSSAYTPAVSGSVFPPTWDCAHSPSVGFLAYLITGRWYFMEEVQFAATCNHLGKGAASELRDGAKGLVRPAIDAWQTRSCAWHLRSLAQACVATPDSDTALRNEFIAAMQYNADDFHGTYVAQSNNTFGFIESGTTAYGGGTAVLAPWQQDFFTATVGYAIAMAPPIASAQLTKWQAFFAWTAQSIVGRLGPTNGTGYPFVSAAIYVLRDSPTDYPNYLTGAGPWYADWATIWANEAATLAASSGAVTWLTATGNTLVGDPMPGERSMWGNLVPAIAYAVRHSVPGAAAAYARLTGATNWNALATAFNNAPVWGVKPAGT